MAVQHRSGVLAALVEPRDNTPVLEQAFCALVAWPQEGMIVGLAGSEDAVDLLGSIAAALVAIVDQHPMPDHIIAVLEHEAARRGWSLVQPTYYGGATYVQAHIGHWRDVLRSAKTDGEPVAIGWWAEAQSDRTVVVQHADGHRIVFGFASGQGIDLSVRSVQWATEGDHDGAYLDALRMARGIAKASGWGVTASAGTITSGG